MKLWIGKGRFLCGGVPRTESGKKLQQSYLATFRRRSILPIKGTGDSDMRASRLSHAKRERFTLKRHFRLWEAGGRCKA